MGYQFLHLDGYARKGSRQKSASKKMPSKGGIWQGSPVQKWSAQDIANEAERMPDACPHVPSPAAPTLRYGSTPSEAVKRAEAWADGAKDAQGRKLRQDGLCLAAGVVSLPAEQIEDWPRFREATLEWLREQYGERLQSVVEHTDEGHPHLHFYCVPLDGERFEVLHPGRLAAAKKAHEGAKKGAQNTEYKRAMQGWQDDFQNAVAARFGLVRHGPKRRRLTRGQWQSEQAQAKALAAPKPPADVRLSVDDITKRVTKKGLIANEYESGEQLAARLTAVVQEKVAPLAAAAKLGASYEADAHRLQRRVARQDERLQELKARNTELESIAQMLSPAELQQLQKRQATRDEKARIAAEKAAQNAERERRLDTLQPGLLRRTVGAAHTFVEHALEYIKTGAKRSLQGWREVEQKTIVEAITQNGQEPQAVWRDLCEYSPGLVDADSQQKLRVYLEAEGARMLESFERSRGNVRNQALISSR